MNDSEQVALDWLDRTHGVIHEFHISREGLGALLEQFVIHVEAQRWIPTSEKLPDFRVPVLVHGGVAELRIDGWWTYMESPRRLIQWEVTHWQPLPVPPPEVTK